MKYKLYFDGNKTPQGTSCSYCIYDNKNSLILEKTEVLPQQTTVPEAEYHGLIKGIKKFLDFLKNNNISSKDVELEIYGDSQLVIKQLTGEYECKKPQLRVLRSQVRNLLTNFFSYNFNWVPRKENLSR